MSRSTPTRTTESTRTAIDLDGIASYEDGDDTVVCDRREPAAWIRSSVTVPVQC